MTSTDRQLNPGAVLLLTDGTVRTFVQHERRSPPLTIIVRERGGPEREIPLSSVAEVMWSP